MKKSGLADSPLFKPLPPTEPMPSSSEVSPIKNRTSDDPKTSTKRKLAETRSHETMKPLHHGSTTPRNHETTVSRYHDSTIESVRMAVKEFGKEAATHRFTLEEKKTIAEIIHSYKKRNIKTSENEIARIGINFILQEYKQKRNQSILDLVIKALNR